MTAYSIDSLNKYGFYVLTERGARLAIQTRYEFDNCIKVTYEKDSIILLYGFKVMNLEDQKRILLSESLIYKQTIKEQKKRLFWRSVERWAWRGAGVVGLGYLLLK